MKPEMPEDFRIDLFRCRQLGLPESMATEEIDGHKGLFYVPFTKYTLRCIVSEGMSWEHVSVSLSHRCPTWQEMAFVKDLFFQPTECVMQLHPPVEDRVNYHPFCLHLWRPMDREIPRPPAWMVGPKS